MFEINMDEYLDDEVENLKLTFDVICRQWDKKVSLQLYVYVISAYRYDKCSAVKHPPNVFRLGPFPGLA